MMRWNMGDTGFEVEKNDVSVSAVSGDRSESSSLFGYVVESVATTLARIGVSSVVVAVLVALVIATVVFGFSSDEASALGQWCMKCR
ncbi:MAG: hypothetical protein M3464_20090 [Chloroflexota bacterium]|nr:hypothetical protein [Chloroflexota bacterium]